MAITPIGEVSMRFETEQKSGTINIYAGPTEKQMTRAFMHVVPFSENSRCNIYFLSVPWCRR